MVNLYLDISDELMAQALAHSLTQIEPKFINIQNKEIADIIVKKDENVLTIISSRGESQQLALPVTLQDIVGSVFSIYQDQQNQIYDLPFGVFDPSLMILKIKKRIIELTEKEVELLRFFITHPNKVFNKQDLLSGVWAYGSDIETRTLETHIYNLRKKIELDPASPKWIVTEADGYMCKL